MDPRQPRRRIDSRADDQRGRGRVQRHRVAEPSRQIGELRAGSAPALSAGRCGSARQRRAVLGERRGAVGPPGSPADGEQLHRLVAGRDAARDAGAYARERAGHELVLLAAGVQRRGAGERGVDLFLSVGTVVVLGEVLEVRREILDLHAEGAHTEARASPAESAAVGRVELIHALDRDVGHLRSFPVAAFGPFAQMTNDRARIRQELGRRAHGVGDAAM